jgi:uncharacterized protein YcbX
MRGERLRRSAVARTYGIAGDRGWAVRDDRIGEIRSAKKVSALVRFAATYVEEPSGSSTPTVEIDLGEHGRVRSDDPLVDRCLSDALGFAASLWPRQPADADDFYRRVDPIDEDEMRRQLDLAPDDPLPAYAATPPALAAELREYVSPRGTFFDAVDLHLITTSSLTSLAAAAPGADVDVRRFRPNVVVDTSTVSAGFVEEGWVGRHVLVGTVVAEVTMPTSRCVMVTLPQADLPRDRSIMRALVRTTAMDLGVGLTVIEPGEIAVGDPIRLTG